LIGSKNVSRQLSDKQLEVFDQEYVSDALWDVFVAATADILAHKGAHVLDVGGGNGRFVDKILARFPESRATVLEPSALLIARNQPSQRKVVLQGGADDLVRLLGRDKFDVICFNWVLHHLVADTYEQSTRNQRFAISSAAKLLATGGAISIFENSYVPAVSFLPTPGRVIYELTSKRALSLIAKAGGANTAGIGVLFRHAGDWIDLLQQEGFRLQSRFDSDPWRFVALKKIVLNIDSVRTTHLLFRPVG